MTCAESRFSSVSGVCEAQNDDSLAKSHTWRKATEAGMVVACHLGGLFEVHAWVAVAGRFWRNLHIMRHTQSEMGGISGFLLYFRVFISLTHGMNVRPLMNGPTLITCIFLYMYYLARRYVAT